MAEVMAVNSGHAEASQLDEQSSQTPIMPHRLHSIEELNELYPPLEAVEAVDDESEEKDALLEEGVRIAHSIVKQASEFGRRRVQREYPA